MWLKENAVCHLYINVSSWNLEFICVMCLVCVCLLRLVAQTRQRNTVNVIETRESNWLNSGSNSFIYIWVLKLRSLVDFSEGYPISKRVAMILLKKKVQGQQSQHLTAKLLVLRMSVSITMTSQWARWRLKSTASRLFTQRFIQAQIKENTKAPRHWPLCGEFTGYRWIPRTKGQ